MIFFNKLYILIIIYPLANKTYGQSITKEINLHIHTHKKNFNNYILMNIIVPMILVFNSFQHFFFMYIIFFLLNWIWQKGFSNIYFNSYLEKKKYLKYIDYVDKSINYCNNQFKYIKNTLMFINFFLNNLFCYRNELIQLFIFHIIINGLIILLYIKEFNLFKKKFYKLLIKIPKKVLDNNLNDNKNIFNKIEEYKVSNMEYIEKEQKEKKKLLYKNFHIGIFIYKHQKNYKLILMKIIIFYDLIIILIGMFCKKILQLPDIPLISMGLQLIKIIFISQWSWNLKITSHLNNNKNINKIKKIINKYVYHQYSSLKTSIITLELIFIFFNIIHKYNYLEINKIPLKIFDECIESIFYNLLKKFILIIIVIYYNKKINFILK